MKPIFTSIGTIALVAAAVVGGTGAFFSDLERSTGNTFAAGVIDLMIDNESYYNLNKCSEVEPDIWQWVGTAAYPAPNSECITSFPQSNLDEGEVFFAFDDVKPDDEGEDTISIHAGSNDAYVCMDLELTSNDDRSTNEPESLTSDPADDVGNEWDGELASTIEMFWWADDGDNVYEEGEDSISNGVKSLIQLAPQGGSFSLALADALGNVWDETTNPIPGGDTVYIAKAWCVGDLTLNPVAAGQGVNPTVASGVTCNGTAVGNEVQTDGVTLDVMFRSIQARHNPGFTCNTSISLIKEVVNDDLGQAQASAWTLSADGPALNDFSGLGPVVNSPADMPGGVYTLSESGGPIGYTASTWTCEINGGAPIELVGGQLTIQEGDQAVCRIINDDNEQVACLPVQQYADAVASVDQGLRKNGTAVLPDRSNTSFALGAPQSTGAAVDVPVVPSSFFSLGFTLPGNPAEIVLTFNNNVVVNGVGNDLKLWEVTGPNYPDERIDVYVGNSAVGPWTQVGDDVTRDAELEFTPAGVTSATHVRIVDASNIALFPADADGYDLDAVQAVNCLAPQLQN